AHLVVEVSTPGNGRHRNATDGRVQHAKEQALVQRLDPDLVALAKRGDAQSRVLFVLIDELPKLDFATLSRVVVTQHIHHRALRSYLPDPIPQFRSILTQENNKMPARDARPADDRVRASVTARDAALFSASLDARQRLRRRVRRRAYGPDRASLLLDRLVLRLF